MFGHRKAQPKEEHPASFPDGEATHDPYGFPVKYRSPVIPPQGGDATIPIEKRIIPSGYGSYVSPEQLELLNRPRNPSLDVIVRK